jgi:hypothetical protein
MENVICMIFSCIVVARLKYFLGKFENSLEFIWLKFPSTFKFYVCMMFALIGWFPLEFKLP